VYYIRWGKIRKSQNHKEIWEKACKTAGYAAKKAGHAVDYTRSGTSGQKERDQHGIWCQADRACHTGGNQAAVCR